MTEGFSGNSTRTVILSVVIVRACGRSSKYRTLNLARPCHKLARRDYWMPRLKRGMTTARSLKGEERYGRRR